MVIINQPPRSGGREREIEGEKETERERGGEREGGRGTECT